MRVAPLASACGAEVHDVDVSGELSATRIDDLRALFVEHQVLVFRDQQWSVDQQVAFGQAFGELDEHPFVHGQPGRPEVLDIITEPDDRVNFGGGWHTDVTFLQEPDLGSILYAIEVPDVGGDTLFASQLAAYDALSPPMQEFLGGLTAVHTAGLQYTEGAPSTQSKAMRTKNANIAGTTVEHPVIRTHPESGRKGLYVNPAFTTHIRGLKRAESRALLDFLYSHGTREPMTARVKWQPGTVAMWDNRSVQHYALHDYAGQRRHMRRITVKGDRPV